MRVEGEFVTITHPCHPQAGVSLPEVELDDALVTIARYHPVQSRRAAARLGDAEAMLLTLPAPEGSGRVILGKVRVRRLQ